MPSDTDIAELKTANKYVTRDIKTLGDRIEMYFEKLNQRLDGFDDGLRVVRERMTNQENGSINLRVDVNKNRDNIILNRRDIDELKDIVGKIMFTGKLAKGLWAVLGGSTILLIEFIFRLLSSR